jgi:hypothetical protein
VARTGMALLEPRAGLAALAVALSSTSGAYPGGPSTLSAVPFMWPQLLPRFKVEKSHLQSVIWKDVTNQTIVQVNLFLPSCLCIFFVQ